VNQNLPGFIAMCPGGYPIQESQNLAKRILPGIYQGTYINTKHQEIEKLIEHIKNKSVSAAEQRQQLDLLHGIERANMRAAARKTRRWKRAFSLLN